MLHSDDQRGHHGFFQTLQKAGLAILQGQHQETHASFRYTFSTLKTHKVRSVQIVLGRVSDGFFPQKPHETESAQTKRSLFFQRALLTYGLPSRRTNRERGIARGAT